MKLLAQKDYAYRNDSFIQLIFIELEVFAQLRVLKSLL